MKKHIKILTVLFGSILFLTSCSNENTDSSSFEELQKNSQESMKVEYNLLDYTPNVYHNYFTSVDNTIGFSSIRPNPLSHSFSSQRNALYGEETNLDIAVNNSKITQEGAISKIDSNEIDAIFGQEIELKIERSGGEAFKDGDESKNVKMYVPKKINISNPKIEEEKDLLPICYYEDFILEWNADPKNEEGLVVVAEYLGMSAIPEKDKNSNIVNTDIIEIDNGKSVLDNNLWQGIPDTGIVHLTLLRGNVKIQDIENEQYKFYAETHATVSIILLRDMETLE